MAFFASRTPSAPFKHPEYDSFFQSRKHAGDSESHIVGWLESNGVDVLVQSVHGSSCAALSVGCGDGKTDKHLITAASKRLEESASSFTFVGCEPDAEPCKRFNELLNSTSEWKLSELSSVYETLFTREFVDTLASKSLDFGLVTFVHCIHLFPEPYGALDMARELLSESDASRVAVLSHVKNGVPLLYEKLGSKKQFFNADALKEGLTERGVQFSYTELPCRVDVTECVKRTEEGRRILMFMLSMEEPDEECYRVLQEMSVTDESTGKTYLHEHLGVFLIPK